MIKLSKPYIPEKAISEAVKILRSGNLVQGKYVKRFEQDLCKYLNVKYVVAVSSGTAALHLALITLGIKAGDEVIVPAFTYPATANVVEIVGAKSVFVDIDLDDFCIDTDQMENYITPKTKAIIPVHEFGQSAKIDKILSLAKKYNLYLIEDAACALGTEFRSQKVGTFGNMGCFSLHPRKAITTGEGGFIATNDDEIAEKARSLRNHGIKANGSGKFDFFYTGFNYRMTDFQAALGIPQLQIIETIIAKRIKSADLYDKKLSAIDWIKTPVKFDERKMVYQTYHILVDENIDRDFLIKYFRENNIETNIGAYALNGLTYFKQKYALNDSSMPNASKAYTKGIALPMSYHLNNNDIQFTLEKLKLFNN